MKRFLSWLMIIMVLAAPAALADTTITAAGSATVRAEPDMATVSVGVQESQVDVAAAQRLVNEKINAVVEALVGAGVAEADIQTESYNIYIDYSTYYDTSIETQYIASTMLQVTTHDVNRAGELIDIAFAAGANQIGGVSFGVQDMTAMQDKALELAVADGMRRARIIAAASGVTLPALPEAIEEGGVYSSYDGGTASAYAMDTAADEEGATKLMSGMVSVTASVSVSYEVEN